MKSLIIAIIVTCSALSCLSSYFIFNLFTFFYVSLIIIIDLLHEPSHNNTSVIGCVNGLLSQQMLIPHLLEPF